MQKPSKTDILLSLFISFAFLGIIFYMSYQDMHPSAPKLTEREIKRVAASYYITPSATANLVPDDGLPVMIHAGEISVSKGGKARFKQNSIEPTTFPQRQVNLSFKIRNIPEDHSGIVERIHEHIDVWEKHGNNIVAILTDYQPRTPNFKHYKALLKTLKGTAKTKLYHTSPTVPLSWIGNPKYKKYLDLKDVSSSFLIKYSGQEPEAFIKQTKDIGFAFRIKLPSTDMERNKELLKTLRQHEFFGNTMLTIDSNSPVPEEEDPIQLLPTFLN